MNTWIGRIHKKHAPEKAGESPTGADMFLYFMARSRFSATLSRKSVVESQV